MAEGLRQLDEWNRLAPKFPPFESPVKLAVDRGELPTTVHPLTQEILRLLESAERVSDVVDNCTHPDYQVLRTLHTLAERGIVEFGRARLVPPEA
ncbi:MAG: response regulator, partial [bacterium]